MKLGIGGNDIKFENSKENSIAVSSNSDSKSALTLMPDYTKFPPKRLTRTRTEHILYPGQMVYGSGYLSKISTKASEPDQSSSSKNFVSSCTAKSH